MDSIGKGAGLYRWAWTLLPLALDGERGPVIGLHPPRLPPHRNLSRAQRRRRAQALLQHALIEPLHQLGRSLVSDIPQTGHQTWGARVHEASDEAHQAFTLDGLAQRGLTRAQDQ